MQPSSIPARNRFHRAIVVLSVLAALVCEYCSLPPLLAKTSSYKVLVFSATAGFRHDSIPDGIAVIRTLGSTNNFSVDATEDATAFTEANLAQYKAVIFLCTTGD